MRWLALLLLVPLTSAVAIDDPAGDVTMSIGSAPVDEPAVDIVRAEGRDDNGTVELTLQLNGALPLGSGDADRLHSHLLLAAYGAEPGEAIFQQIAEQRDAIAIVCEFHEGLQDLTCQTTVGDALMKGISAEGSNVTVRFTTELSGDFQVGASSTISIPNATAQSGREIIAQDFTDNALPYATRPPDDAEPAVQAEGSTPWYKTPWMFLVLALLVIAGYAVWSGRSSK